MIHEKLRNIRKQRGVSQETMAKILSTDVSNYCRKERGETKMYDDEWVKIAKFLKVSLEELKEKSTLNDNPRNCNQYYTVPNYIIDDYINLLKEQNEILKEENVKLKKELEIIRLKM